MRTLMFTPAMLFRRALALGAFGVLILGLRADPPGAEHAALASQLVGFIGKVEIFSGTNGWHAAATNQWLYPGDRLRTRRDSRATLQLSDRSTIRIDQLTTLEIVAPKSPAQHGFQLQEGALFFLDREKPADIEFETPLTSGAIRGTEFFLTVEGANPTTHLAMLDGAVELSTAAGKQEFTNGQQIVVAPNAPPRLVAALPMANLMQWSFYYPAVVNPADLAFTPEERHALAASLSDYQQGDLFGALAGAPGDWAAHSAGTRIYFAALKLAVGQVDEAERLIGATGPAAGPLRELIAAVKFQPAPVSVPANSSGWLARSYLLQSQSKLSEALDAARKAVERAPDFGFAWARVAELEFGFEHRRAALKALERARQLSPRNAQVVALEGFVALSEYRAGIARDWFERAQSLDSSLPTAWVGRALAREQLGDAGGARKDFQVAAALEPNRGLFRSYLGKAWGQTGEDQLARKDFAMAGRLDPGDPTGPLYAALHDYQTHHINEAVRELEHSEELNNDRSVFRSRLQLDRDLATRSADLAAIYDAAGLTEASRRAASRAVEDSYSDFEGHLFLADSFRAQLDPEQFDLRYETAQESELLIANLLAPPGGGNLSQLLSQQDRLQYFGARPFGLSTLTEYLSRGDWLEEATAFGNSGNFSYAFDAFYQSQNGQRPNNEFESRQFSFQAKDQITPSDGVYFQLGFLRNNSGDVAQRYDPQSAVAGLHAIEEQTPNVFLGWNHEWSPGSHTLVLLSRLTDRLSLTNPQPSVLFMLQNGAGIVGVEADPFFTLQQDFNFTLYSAEAQQIFESDHQALIFGARYQRGNVETHAGLSRLFSEVSNQSSSPYLERLNGYGYYQWRPIDTLWFTAGLSYDDLNYPQNVDSPPVEHGQAQRSLLGPKAGITWEPWTNGWLRGAWSRSLGGLFFDNSIRLEPAQVAGFTSAYRSLIPESVEGIVPGTKFDSWNIGFDQSLRSETFFGVEGEWLTSDGSRDVGAFTNSLPFIPAPNSPTATAQRLDFRERNASAYVYQLLGDEWSAGAQYRLSEARLQTSLPALTGVSGVSSLEGNNRAVLHHAELFLLFNHPSGFFAEWTSEWYHQDNHGYSPALNGDDFWQHNVFAGYVFPRRRAEVRLGLLNITGQNYRLNPLNLQSELPRGRTFAASLRINF